MMMGHSLPSIKSFFRGVSFDHQTSQFLIRLMAAFMMHIGRMTACQAASSIRTDPRHRAAVTRFLHLSELANSGCQYLVLARAMIRLETRAGGRWLFELDKTNTTRQGSKTENTYSTGNRKRRPRKGRRYSKYKRAPRGCHGFVMGLLITPSGYRIPFHRCHYTRAYCKQKGLPYRTESELGAELIRQLPVPEDTEVVVLGDTAYDADSVHEACQERGFSWITPANAERVLAGEKPRPQVRSLLADFSARSFHPIRLTPGRGAYVAQRRLSPCRIGPKAKTKTYYAHRERLRVHSVGAVQVVFSTTEKPIPGKPVELEKTKILMTNNPHLSPEEIVELYDLRWQIELFFKELKSTLGFHQYRFRRFAAVESWVEACLITFLYLEWYRAKKLQRRDLSEEAKNWWRVQRTYGLCQAVRQEVEADELERMAEWTNTKTGLKRLKRLLRAARPKEYRLAA